MHSSNPPGMLLTTHPFTERHSPYIWIQAASRGEICLKDSQEARGERKDAREGPEGQERRGVQRGEDR